MKLLFAVQRYGEGVAGGAETACRVLAEKMVECGHDVTVVTSCAESYVDWTDVFPPGPSRLNGVRIHRLPVEHPRRLEEFAALSQHVTSHRPVPLHLARRWAEEQGPTLQGYAAWMRAHAGAADCAIFYTYLYETTTSGIAPAATRTATLLHPAAHEEWPLYLPVYDSVVRQADGFFFHTPEEGDLVRERFGVDPAVSDSPGLGIDPAPPDPHPAAFRKKFGLADDPYLLVLGRVDPNKGTAEAIDYFQAYKRRRVCPLRLVVMGDRVHDLPTGTDVVVTGFVDERTKHDALAGALCLVQPSYLESFSIVLAEAWQHGTPAIVQRACAVLDGQVGRSGGGLTYRGFAEFEAALDSLIVSPALRNQLGACGRDHVESRYTWRAVEQRYEALLRRTVERGQARLSRRAE